MIPFHRFPSVESFRPAGPGEFSFGAEPAGGGAWLLTCTDGDRWPASEASFPADTLHLAGRIDPLPATVGWDCRGLSLALGGKAALSPVPGLGFRVSGSSWALTLEWDPSMRFYGQGAKSGPLERTGLAVKFWNTDVAGEFAESQLELAQTDPMYVSIPWLIIERDGLWTGLLLDNPYLSFMYTNRDPRFYIPEVRDNHLVLGALDGAPRLWLFTAPDPKTLVRAFQRLVGAHPRPPLWSLGHHQCRWGYDHAGHLDEVARKMVQYGIPNSGLWLDIGYMEGYRVFTWNRETMADPARQLDELCRRYGMRVVPILDPGVKREPGYGVYDSGVREGIFCRTGEGTEYVGYVWPGDTVFPDFSLPGARLWWAAYCRDFMAKGADGAWIDMNDPSTGWADSGSMLFSGGSKSHSWYHNRYASGMAEATFRGFQEARPRERPFIISRSAYTGQARYSAVWLGDNRSNWNHLATMIPMALNLSLSGIPFNGPDAPGFDREATPLLAREWYKAQFLFPFLRNHSSFYAPPKEPWVFGARSLRVIRRYIRLRYRLLPYLYQCFVAHERDGDPVLRPLWYEFPSFAQSGAPDGETAMKASAQFFTGPSLLQAPFVDDLSRRREAILPPGAWYDLSRPGPFGRGRFLEGGRTVSVRRGLHGSPAWARVPSALACRVEAGSYGDASARVDPWSIDLHVFARDGDCVEVRHVFDDGETVDWQDGCEVRLVLSIEVSGRRAVVRVLSLSNAHPGAEPRPVSFRFSFYVPVGAIELEGPDGVRRERSCSRGLLAWTGRRRHRVWRSEAFTLG